MPLQFAIKLQVFLHSKSTGNIDIDMGVLVGVGWVFCYVENSQKADHQDVVFFEAILTFTGNLAIFLSPNTDKFKIYIFILKYKLV